MATRKFEIEVEEDQLPAFAEMLHQMVRLYELAGGGHASLVAVIRNLVTAVRQ